MSHYEQMIRRMAASAPRLLREMHGEMPVVDRRNFLKISIASGFALGVFPTWSPAAEQGAQSDGHK
jgi:hypothetical protein